MDRSVVLYAVAQHASTEDFSKNNMFSAMSCLYERERKEERLVKNQWSGMQQKVLCCYSPQDVVLTPERIKKD